MYNLLVGFPEGTAHASRMFEYTAESVRAYVAPQGGPDPHYRNPRAQASRRGSNEDKQDFFEAFALFSYVHRRLDRAGVAR